MAGKITDASALTGANVATGDQLELVDVSDTSLAASGTNKKITADELAIALGTTLGLVGRDKIWDTKGDLAVATGADAASKLAVGSAGQALMPQSSASTGLAYGRPLPLRAALLPTGALAGTLERPYESGAQLGALTSGTLWLTAIAFPKDLLITAISFLSGGSTTLASATNQWFGLFDSSRVPLRFTSDDTSTAWSTNTVKTLNLTSTYTTTTEGLHYLGILVAAGTMPTLRGLVLTGTVPSALAPIIAGTSSTGLTTTASCPNPAGAISPHVNIPFAWVS